MSFVIGFKPDTTILKELLAFYGMSSWVVGLQQLYLMKQSPTTWYI